MFTERIFVPRLRLFSRFCCLGVCLFFVCLFVLSGVESRHVYGESTPITHWLNDWALLVHLSSPYWSRQHSNRGFFCMLAGEDLQRLSWLLCRRWLLVYHLRESTPTWKSCNRVAMLRVSSLGSVLVSRGVPFSSAYWVVANSVSVTWSTYLPTCGRHHPRPPDSSRRN